MHLSECQPIRMRALANCSATPMSTLTHECSWIDQRLVGLCGLTCAQESQTKHTHPKQNTHTRTHTHQKNANAGGTNTRMKRRTSECLNHAASICATWMESEWMESFRRIPTSVCECVCVWVRVCVSARVCECACVWVCVCVSARVCVWAPVSVPSCTYWCVDIHVCVCVCLRVTMCSCLCVAPVSVSTETHVYAYVHVCLCGQVCVWCKYAPMRRSYADIHQFRIFDVCARACVYARACVHDCMWVLDERQDAH